MIDPLEIITKKQLSQPNICRAADSILASLFYFDIKSTTEENNETMSALATLDVDFIERRPPARVTSDMIAVQKDWAGPSSSVNIGFHLPI